MVKEFIANNDVAQIKRLTSVLTTEFSVSHNPHSRKGGLIGLAATAIALGKVKSIVFGQIDNLSLNSSGCSSSWCPWRYPVYVTHYTGL